MVVDIEETETEGATEPTVEIVPVIVAELGKQNITKDLILAKATEYASITIGGIDDRDGLKIAKEARRTLVETRSQIDKMRVNLNADALRTQRQNNSVAKELTAMIFQIEEPIDNQIKAIESEVEKRRQDRENEKAQRIATRTNSLMQLGAILDAGTYNIHGFEVDAIEVTTSPDDEFADLLQQATEARDTHVQEQARIAQEQFDLAEKLRVQKEEQEREEQRQEEERKSLAKMKLETRIGALAAVGMPHFERTGQSYLKLESINTLFALTDAEILSLSVEQFGEYIIEVKTKKADSDDLDEKARQKQIADDAEKARRQQVYNSRVDQLKDAGFIQLADKFVDTLNGEFQVHQIDLSEFTDDEFTTYLTGFERNKVEVEKALDRADKEKKRADRERTARLKPERKDLLEYLRIFNKGRLAVDYKEPEIAEVYERFYTEIDAVVERYREIVKAL